MCYPNTVRVGTFKSTRMFFKLLVLFPRSHDLMWKSSCKKSNGVMSAAIDVKELFYHHHIDV